MGPLGVVFVDPYQGKWGCINLQGEPVLPFEFGEIDPSKESQAPVKVQSGWGIIDRSGNFVVPRMYGLIFCFHEGIARIVTRNHAGVMDLSFHVLLNDSVMGNEYGDLS